MAESMKHLLRRATFGPTAAEVDAAEKAGWDATVTRLVTPSTTDKTAPRMPDLGPDPYALINKQSTQDARKKAQQARKEQIQQTIAWWLDRMVAAEHQFAEKLVFFWHGHWATSVQKVNSAQLMLRQQKLFRDLGHGDFRAFVSAMVRDPALIIWLDGQRNTAKAPNENLARELMELFTLGIGAYSEDDVKSAARALTGWMVDRAAGVATLNPKRHDDKARSLDELVADVTREPPVFVARRLWFRFAASTPMPDEVAKRVGQHRDITTMARAMFTDPAFPGTTGQLVKQPVEWAVGAMRQLGIRPSRLDAKQQKALLNGLNMLDQVPLRPPSVGGWPAGAAWLTTSSVQARLRAADGLAMMAPESVVDRLEKAPKSGRVDAVARLLVVDAWTKRSRDALTTAADNPRRLLTLALASPEYTIH